MATGTKIEWTQATWNPVTGCTQVSLGCQHCYAKRMAMRLQAMGQERYRNGFEPTLHYDLVDLPRHWAQSRLVFVNSMSDLFHEQVPLEFVQRVFDTISQCSRHTFQILTKRSTRLAELAPKLTWYPNIWMGVSVEDRQALSRVADLHTVPAAIRFISCEPLLGLVDDIPLDGIDWVIVGGESGPRARLMKPEWVDSIWQQCRIAQVPFFFKQWGGVQKKRAGRLLYGRTYDEMPQKR
jgi:protein gp37